MQRLLGLLALTLVATTGAQPDVMDITAAPELGEVGEVGEELGDIGEGLEGVNEPIIGEEEPEATPEESREEGFATRIGELFSESRVVASIGIAAIGLGGALLVSRYMSPKEALKNPQRAMLYGFVRAQPGIHLKQLSDEFGMKTSSILWHIRKLESAQLVRSERANGFRVFYPVEGGVEIKRVSRAIASLQNENARRIFESIRTTPGSDTNGLAKRLSIHPGTVRWHIKKLRDFGVLEEISSEGASRFFATDLGGKALEAREGKPTTDLPVPSSVEA